MPVVHNALQYYTRLIEAYRRAFGETRSPWGVERLGETITPTLDLWARPEWALLRGEILFGASGSTVAGAAGTFGKVGIHNRVNSRLMAVVTHHVVTGVAVSVGVSLELDNTVLADTAAVLPADRRLTAIGTDGVIVQSEASAGAAVGALVTVTAIAGDNVVIEWPVVLPPGRGCRWRTSDDAAPLNASFRGYLWLARPGELNV